MSQFCYIGLTFPFVKMDVCSKVKKSQKLLDFCQSIETRPYIKILRHTSLHENVFYTCWKFNGCKYDNKEDIHVKTMKIEKSV